MKMATNFKHLTPAEKLLCDLGVDSPNKIDLEVIAAHVGCSIKHRDLRGCEARILAHGDRAVISVDSKVSPLRQRFSIAHELGHWNFHKGKDCICESSSIGNWSIVGSEHVADEYAANLLMPRFLFTPEAAGMYTNFRFIDQLSKTFQCSLTATAIRMIEHGPEPAIIICHGRNGRKWFIKNKDVPEKWFPRKHLDRESYVYDVQFGSAKTCKRGEISADAWFDRDNAYTYEVYEEATKIPNHETLTLITFKSDGMLEE